MYHRYYRKLWENKWTLVPFSAEKGVGKEELISLLNAACER